MYASCTVSSDVPILLALSLMSMIAVLAISAAASVLPPSELISAAAKFVEISM